MLKYVQSSDYVYNEYVANTTLNVNATVVIIDQ